MKRSEKSRKASRVDANKAKQADFDRAIRERIRDGAGLHIYQPVPGPGTAQAVERGETIL